MSEVISMMRSFFGDIRHSHLYLFYSMSQPINSSVLKLYLFMGAIVAVGLAMSNEKTMLRGKND
jgi:hypothetical protein